MCDNSALESIIQEPTSEFGDKLAEMVLTKWVLMTSEQQRRSLNRTVVAGIVMERELRPDEVAADNHQAIPGKELKVRTCANCLRVRASTACVRM